MTTQSFSLTDRTQVKRNPGRAVYDREVIYEVLDEAMLGHLAVAIDGEPFVLLTIHTRIGDTLYLHGSNQNRLYRKIAEGAKACISITILNGLVLAHSGLHHSMNYRTVVLFANGEKVEDREEEWRVLEALVEQIVPGRWEDSRQPTLQKLNATMVIAFPINKASAKVRDGPPINTDADRELPIWAGVMPIKLCTQAPITDTAGQEVPVPEYVRDYEKLPSVSLP